MASLREKLNTKLAAAWIKLDDVPVAGIVRKTVTTSYSPEAGVVENNTDFPVNIIFDKITEADRLVNQGKIENSGGLGDLKMLIPLLELDYIPAVGDRIIVEGEDHEVALVDIDPARVLFTGFVYKRGKINDELAR